jgi:hypothetical protein
MSILRPILAASLIASAVYLVLIGVGRAWGDHRRKVLVRRAILSALDGLSVEVEAEKRSKP